MDRYEAHVSFEGNIAAAKTALEETTWKVSYIQGDEPELIATKRSDSFGDLQDNVIRTALHLERAGMKLTRAKIEELKWMIYL